MSHGAMDLRAHDGAHPGWLRVLEALQVPFVVYRRDGAREHVSDTATALLDGAGATLVLLSADRIVADEIKREASRLRIGSFALVREVEHASADLILSVYLLDPAEWYKAIAIVRPRPKQNRGVIPGLSRRESEVAHLIGAGLSTKEIARRLGISSHTTRHHIERIFTRLGVTTRAAVVSVVAGGTLSSPPLGEHS